MSDNGHRYYCSCDSCEDWRLTDGDAEDALMVVGQSAVILLLWIGGLLVLKYAGQIAWGVWGGR